MSLVRTIRRRMARRGLLKVKERVRVMNLAQAAALPATYERNLALASLPLVGPLVGRHLARRYISA